MVVSQRKYICSFCAKAFSRSEHKARHERSHTGLKPFECKVCRHAFVRRDLLQRHIRTVHRELLLLRRNLKDGEALRNYPSLSSDSHEMKNDLMVELLVNSMIQISSHPEYYHSYEHEHENENENEDENPSKERGKRQVLTSCSFLPKPSLDKEHAAVIYQLINAVSDSSISIENVVSFFNSGLTHILENDVFANSIISSLVGVLNGPSSLDRFQQFCTSSSMILTITCLGAFILGDECADTLWQISWSSCTKSPVDQKIISLNLLIHTLLEYKTHRNNHIPNIQDVFAVYQHSCHIMTNLDARQIHYEEREIWLIFHIWVSLLRLSNETNKTSTSIYKWFLKQRIQKNDDEENITRNMTLKDLLSQVTFSNDNQWSLTTLNYIADALFCDWIIFKHENVNGNKEKGNLISHFKSKQEFHNAIIMTNKMFASKAGSNNNKEFQDAVFDLPPKFSTLVSQYLIPIQSESHWLLLETTWFEFIKNVTNLSMPDNVKKVWFMDLTSDMTTVCMDSSLINNNLALCALPVLSIIETSNNVNPRYTSLIADVVLFLVRLFEFEMSVANAKYSPGRIIGFLENPIVQLLLFVGRRIIYRNSKFKNNGAYDNETSVVDHFLDKYIAISKKNIDTDVLVKEELSTILFDTQSSACIGYHQLMFSIVSYLKEDVIANKLMKLSYMNQDIKSHLAALLQESVCFREYPTTRRLTDPWQSPPPLWMLSPQSRSMSVDSTINDMQGHSSVAMRNSISLDSSTFRNNDNSNIILPPLNINAIGRSGPHPIVPRHQQHPSYYSYGPVDPIYPKSSFQSNKPGNFITPFVNTNPTSMDGIFMEDRVTNTSPRSPNDNVRLPPPSELFGVSSR